MEDLSGVECWFGMEKPLFEIEETLSLPKYRQIVNGIIAAIQQKELNR